MPLSDVVTRRSVDEKTRLPTAPSAARASDEQKDVEANLLAITQYPLFKAMLDAAGVSVMVLNRNRQIIVGSPALVAALGANPDSIRALTPGEAMQCVHAAPQVGGCGASKECAPCGLLQISVGSRPGVTVERECLMTIQRGDHVEAHELRVRATTWEYGNEPFTVLGLRDISAEKRRDALERVFLHDISNTVGALLLQAHALAAEVPATLVEAAHGVKSLANRLRREIEDQRVLLQAERGTLELKRAEVDPNVVIEAAAALMKGHPAAAGRTVEVVPLKAAARIVTDESLVVRVLVNMVKNALEATPKGGVVTLSLEVDGGSLELRVRNPGVIPPDVALQIFKRSFSTKPGGGRGLGTFSMKLMGERYLGGQVGFTSSVEAGTTFFLRLPT